MSDITNQPAEESKGSLIGSIIIVLILILGAVYLYFNRSAGTVTPVNSTATSSEAVATAPDDNLTTLQSDLNASTSSSAEIDSDFNALSQEFNQ